MNFEEVKTSPVGIWFVNAPNQDTKKVLIKTSTYLLKHIYIGVKTELIVGIYNSLNTIYPMLALKIFDDTVYPSLITEKVEVNQLGPLESVMSSEKIEVNFYDELGALSLIGYLRIDINNRFKFLEFYGGINYSENDRNIIKASDSLDSFTNAINEKKATDEIIKFNYFEIKFYDLVQIENHHLGWGQTNKISLGDFNEGDKLEHQIAIVSESIFKQNTFKNPLVKNGKFERELTDVFMMYDRGLFLIETKASSVLNKKDQKFERKINGVIKQIKKGVNQLIGANKKLRKGCDLFDTDGCEINYNSEAITQNIVLVSEVVHLADREDLKQFLLNSMVDNNLSIQLMGFDEYMLIIKAAEGKKELFDYYLMERMKGWVKKGCPLNFKIMFTNNNQL